MEPSSKMNDQQGSDDLNWPFAEPKNVAVFTTDLIIRRHRAILRVSHDEEDGAWQFHDGDNPSMQEAKVVSLQFLVELDPSLRELADLPLGWEANRVSIDQPWQKRRK